MANLGIWILFFTILPIIGACVLAFQEKKEVPNKLYIKICLFVILAGSVVTVVLQKIKDNNEDEKTEAKNNEISDKTNKIIKLQERLTQIGDSIKDIQDKSIKYLNSANEMQREMLGYTAGEKNNKPFLFFSLTHEISHKRKIVNYCICNFGKYPIKNVKMIISDPSSLQAKWLEQIDKYHIKDVDSTIRIYPRDYTQFVNFGDIESINQSCEYKGLLLEGKTSMEIAANISWQGGAYDVIMKINLDGKNSVYYIEKMDFYEKDKLITNPEKYFDCIPKKYHKRLRPDKIL